MPSNKDKQPLSLKWKWGILLFIGLMLVGCAATLIFARVSANKQFEAFHQKQQDIYTSTINYLEKQNTIFVEEPRLKQEDGSVRQSISPSVLNMINLIENDDRVIRIYNLKNQMVYETKAVEAPIISESAKLQHLEHLNNDVLVGSKQLISQDNHKVIGSIEFIVLPNSYRKLVTEENRLLYLILLTLLVTSLLLSTLLTAYFLIPLNYLNNTLDLVEEESLSEIRIRRPQSNDEWSDLNVHINRMLDKIDLYVRNQKQFVEDVSHELRTPVAIVEGHLKMLNRWGKSDPEVLEESISASLQEITRMKDLVQEMLDLSRADHIEVDYKDEITEAYSTIRQIYNNFVMIHPEFSFYLDSEREGKELYLKIFRNHFEQILIILLDNAVKYSRDRQEIHISVATSFTHIEIAVQDFGEGMTEEDKDKVFGRFYRVDKARSRNKGGNGLGLSIAKQLVESYRGNIRVESVFGNGSIFYVEFPILNDARQIHKSKMIQQQKQL